MSVFKWYTKFLGELKYEENRHTDSVIPNEYTRWTNNVKINPDQSDSIVHLQSNLVEKEGK